MKDKLRILQIANGDFFSFYGGGQVYVKNIVDEMIVQGLDVVIFSFINKKSDTEITECNYKGIAVYEISRLNIALLREKIKQISPDIIHAHAQKSLFAQLSDEFSIPYIVTAHHGGIVCPAGTLLNYKDEICHIPANQKDCLPCVLKNIKTGFWYYPLLKRIPLRIRLKIGKCLSKLPFMYFVTPIGSTSLAIGKKQEEWQIITDKVDMVIAPSVAIAESMELNGLRKEKIRIVPHGIPFNLPVENYVPVTIENRIVRFFYIGRICYVKGIHILLNAFSKIQAERCELHLIGDTNDTYTQRLIRNYSPNKNIFFHGRINPEEVQKYIRQFDILVHPAIYMEVFGLNIAEALLEGKPVIASRCGGAEMQIINGENGLLVPPNDLLSLVEAMKWMTDHSEEVKKMSENAARHVIPMSSHVRQLVQVYKENFYEKKSMH